MALFNVGTNKQGLIVYGGESSTDYGIVVGESPAFDKPTRKQTIYQIPGRNGSVLFQEDAFEDVTRSYRVWLAEDNGDLTDKVNAFTSWLFSKKGYTRLEDSFEPDIFRLGYYSGGQNVSNEMTQYGETTISFVCRPERFYKSGENPIDVTGGTDLFNPTRFNAKPLIHIEGSGEITVQIASRTITADVVDYINIDCDRMNAYRDPKENRNDEISGTFPIIEPGTNTVTITGTVTKVEVTPRYYTI